MKFIFIPLIVFAFNAVVKFVFLLLNKRPFFGNKFTWTFIWVGQFPSGHAATLASCLMLVWYEYGLGSLFGFCFFVSYMLIYGFLEDKKRQSLFEGYFIKSSDSALQRISTDKILMDFSGHKLLDVLVGVVEGIVVTYLIFNYFF